MTSSREETTPTGETGTDEVVRTPTAMRRRNDRAATADLLARRDDRTDEDDRVDAPKSDEGDTAGFCRRRTTTA